jgi:hypothetical protein
MGEFDEHVKVFVVTIWEFTWVFNQCYLFVIR